IVLEAPALGARLVRPAEEQAVETTQFAGLILKQCAAFLAMQQVVFDWRHWSKVLAEALLSDKNLAKMTQLLVHVVGAPNGAGHFLAQQFGITHAESQKMAAQGSDGHLDARSNLRLARQVCTTPKERLQFTKKSCL